MTTIPHKPQTKMIDISTGRGLCATMTKSWISNGSAQSNGLTFKHYAAPHASNHPLGSGSNCSKHNTLSCGPSRITGPCLPHPIQPGKCFSSAGSLWGDQPRTPLMLTAPASWRLDWTSSGLRNGLHYGPWCVLNATLLLLLKHAQGQRPTRPKQESARVATLAQAGEKGRALALPGRPRSIQCPSLTHLHS